MNTNFKTLVIGASLKDIRYSNKAIKSLIAHNIETVALGLRKGSVADVEIDTTMKEYKNIHTVTLYLNPERQVAFYQYILNLRPTRVIFNPGTENNEFMKILKKEGISYEVACTLVMLSIGNYETKS